METRLLTIAAVCEGLAGLALILFPGYAIALLLDAEPHGPALMIARVAGVALLSLGVACAGAAMDVATAARRWTVVAITLYNAGAGVLLVAFAADRMAGGVVIWIAGVFHLVLASTFGACFADVHRHTESGWRNA